MTYLRKKDDIVYRLASMQARIFERSSADKIASYFFIQQFMLSKETQLIDSLVFLESGLSEMELYLNTKNNTKRKSGEIYPNEVLHWIGFFYRYASYLTGITSKMLFKKINPKDLYNLYPLYHGLDISKAIDMVLENVKLDKMAPMDRFMNLYRSKKIIL